MTILSANRSIFRRMSAPAALACALLVGSAMAEPQVRDLIDSARARQVTSIDAEGRIFGHGGGAFTPPHDELTEAERSRIASRLQQSRARLTAEGGLPLTYRKTITNFSWPLRSAAGRTDFDYHGISNFVDENPAFPNQLLDYFCGARTYDLASGYNHRGTDIFIWPFSWKKMDDEDVVIVAGAPGTIIEKDDGNFDRSCAMNSNSWNAVYVQHADGSVAWYGHMKSGSLTVKPVGATVVAGEYLGVVGSSGSSTGPHLHLELYDASNALIDPWTGACNSKSKQITWGQQRAYRDSGVNALTIGTAAPNLPACPGAETSFATDFVAPASTVYFTMYLRDQVLGSPATMRVLRPDGTVFTSQTSGNATHDGSYWYWFFSNFPNIPGTWTFEATMAGRTVTKTFQVGGSAAFGAPASILVSSGSSQVAVPGTAFSAPLRAQVLDSQARPVKGAKVTFTVPATGATAILESRSALTDATGIASVAALANATAGSYNVSAAVAGAAAPVSFALQNQAALANPPRLANISTRMQVLTGNDVMIAGFIIGGTVAKTVVVNVAGPSLSAFGITNPLANPTLTLVRSSDNAIIATNDNWQAAANAAQVQTSGFSPANTLEPAILMTLAPGAYTAIVQGVGGTGVGLVGVFEVDHPEVPLINISTRGQVLTGNDVMIAGFIIQGTGPQNVVINVAGPSLSAFGITNPLANPTLTLVRSSDNAILATNDNWQGAGNAAAILSSGFAPANPLEPAIMMSLAPGAYTAIVQGAGGGTGVGLVGVFTAP